MLAEPRRKIKYSSDPRGLNWAKDEEKFGQKLMEKMGWSKGKGLGANEDGIKDHVGVKMKSDTKGVGCSKSYADNWIAHQDDFNALLSQLNGEGVAESSQLQSLEKKSKGSKGRVHYQKFTRGKDLSNAQGKDLDCIFGRRETKSAPVTPQTQSEENSGAEDEVHSGDDQKAREPKIDKSHGFTTISTGTSVSEYFAKKMADMKARLSGATSNQQDSSIDSDKESKKDEQSVSDSIMNVESNDNSTKKSKKKKKSKNKAKDVESPEPETAECDERPPKKKKKKSKKSEIFDSQDNIMDNVDCNGENSLEIDSEKKVSGVLPEEVQAITPEPKKKKRKNKSIVEECSTPDVSHNVENRESKEEDDSLGVNSKDGTINKKKGKKRTAEVVINEITEVDEKSETSAQTIKADSKPKKKKVKKAKTMPLQNVIADAFEGSNLAKIRGYGDGKAIGYSQKF